MNMRWLTHRRPAPVFTFILVGGRGQPSLDILVPRNAETWNIVDGVARNAVALPLPFPNKSAHWILLDRASGFVLFEGRFRRALEGMVVPIGAIIIRDWE